MQTVIESIGPQDVREGLVALKSGISTAASAEQDLIKDKARHDSALRGEGRKYAEENNEKLDVRIHTLIAVFAADNERAETELKDRRAFVQQAYHNAKASLAARVQERKDLRIGKVQAEVMRNRQGRQTELDEETLLDRGFRQHITADRVARRELRMSFFSTFSTFRPWVNPWFVGRRGMVAPEPVGETAEATRIALLKRLELGKEVADGARRLPLVKLFRLLPLTMLCTVLLVVHLWIGMRAGGGGLKSVLPSLMVTEGVLLLLWLVGLLTSISTIKSASAALARARSLEIAALKQSAARIAVLNAEIRSESEEEGRGLSDTFRDSDEERKARMSEGQKKLDAQFARLPEKVERLHERMLERLRERHEEALSTARRETEAKLQVFEKRRVNACGSLSERMDSAIGKLAAKWTDDVLPLAESVVSRQQKSLEMFPAWTAQNCEAWSAPAVAPPAVRIGEIEVDADALSEGVPSDARFCLPGDGHFRAPFALGFPDHASLLIESDDGQVGGLLQGIALRLLASHPPGRASFVFIDPVGLGKDFAGLMHLADYEETLINHRIWTKSTHIEERLAELNEHIEKVIQMYLRDEFPNIVEYNAQAGTIAEKYHFLVIAGFPSGFSDTAVKRLLSIASSGARCGVYLLIQRDMRQEITDPALEDELRRSCLCVAHSDGVFRLLDAPAGADVVVFDSPPGPEESIRLVHRIGRSSVDSNRIQVPFSQIMPADDEIWKTETRDELRVPIGRTGAKKLQMLAIGKGTRQHMLVAGKTGSGKSTLFHVIITNLALWCSPQEVEFYLVDFKKGVEFKCYASKRLPHARVVAIESDREFALSVLQRVDAELKRRGELFRHAGAQDLAGYKRAGGVEAIPRSLLLIDEFQEFFTEDDAVAQEASLLLDRIVRQGRAFGIHVILGSQTLGGAYTLARATLGQMVIRVALQCNETDAHLIMDDDNPAPRMLTRPGEGIYNDQAGAVAANSPFQIVWLPEDERDAVLDRVSGLASQREDLPPAPIIFEGNAPAEVRDNRELAELIGSTPAARPRVGRAWLGAPNSIKGPTEAVFQRQSGSHLLVVGQSAERSMSLLTISMVALAAQYPADQAEFVVLDPHFHETGDDSPFKKLADALPHNIRVGGPGDAGELLNNVAEDLAKRAPSSGKNAPEVFVIVHDLQRFKAVRPDDEFKFSLDDDDSAPASPSQVFSDVLGEGGPCGMHVIASVDTWNNVSRWIPRKLMAEFEMRVLFQMSANDSANLIDSPAATKLGLHRALFYNEHLGTVETFRPYAMPDPVWFEDLGK